MKSEKTKRLTTICLGLLSIILGVVPYVSLFIRTQKSEVSIQTTEMYWTFIQLSWFAAIAIGILAIKTGCSVKFKTGVVLGRFGAGIGAFLFVVNLLMFVCTISDGRQTCIYDLRYLNSAIQQYCKQNEGALPNAEVWCDKILESVENRKLFTTFRGSSSQDMTYVPEGKISNFAFNKNLDGYRLSDIDRQTVLLFETDPGWNQNGTSDILLPEEHPGYTVLIDGGSHFLFVGPDSTITVKFIKNSKIDNLDWGGK